MSDRERPDATAFRELAHLIRALGDEMAGWRRRAHDAETRLKELPPAAAGRVGGASDPRVLALEKENAELRGRLAAASERTKQLVDKMQFLRQQHGAGAEK